MSVRNIAVGLIVVVAFLAGMLWQSQIDRNRSSAASGAGAQGAAPAMPGGPSDAGGAPAMPATPNTPPGISWTVPARWTNAGDRPMRFATYTIPAASGDSEGAECAVFYFGPGQGGGVEENLDRWVQQFMDASAPERAQHEVSGLKVWRIAVNGAYLAPAGPQMQSTATKPGYRLLGAIVEGPNGAVFFKLTGPRKTVQGAEREFDRMLGSVHTS